MKANYVRLDFSCKDQVDFFADEMNTFSNYFGYVNSGIKEMYLHRVKCIFVVGESVGP